MSMKKFTLLFLVLVIAGFVYGQSAINEKKLTKELNESSQIASGSSETIQYLGTPGAKALGDTCNFEGSTFPNTGWTIQFTGTNYWSQGSANGPFFPGSKAAKFDCYSSSTKPTQSLISPTFTASISGELLSFDYAHAPYTGSVEDDSMKVYTSTNGTTYTLLAAYDGNGGIGVGIQTATATGSAFTPTSAQWRTKSIALPVGTVKYKITCRSDYGNDIWLDNILIYTQSPLDLGLTNISLPQYVLTNSNFNVAGTVRNYGTTTITSYTLNYTIDGGSPVTNNVTGVNIASGGINNFTFSTPVNFGTTGERTFVFTITDINGSADPIAANNTMTRIIGALSYAPVKRVMGEEGTGTWCGWCPRGAVYMEEMATAHPDIWVGIAVHNGDPMVVAAYDTEMGNHISGYPSGLIDRQSAEVDPTDFGTAYTARIAQVTPVEMSITGIAYNSVTRVLDFTVQGVLAGDMNGNYRFNAVLTEDNVHGTATGYNQTNYYSSTSNNLPLNGAGHNWQTSANPVPAAIMYYDHVARAIMGGWLGTAGSIASINTAGSTISKTYTTTLNAAWNSATITIVGFIVNQTTGEIVNVCKSDIISSIENGNIKSDMLVYPNPSTGMVYLKNNESVNVTVYNILGQPVMTEQNTQMLNMSSLSAGTYTLRIENGKDVVVKRVVLTK